LLLKINDAIDITDDMNFIDTVEDTESVNITEDVDFIDTNSVISTSDILESEEEYSVFGEIEIRGMYAIDVSDPLEMVKFANYVIRIRVKEIDAVGNIDEGGGSIPSSAIHVETLEVLQGDIGASDIDKIRQHDGLVSMDELLSSYPFPEETAKKNGWDHFSKEERRQQYLYYDTGARYDFVIGDEYIVTLVGNKELGFFLSTGGYDVFVKNESNSSIVDTFENVITKNQITLEEFMGN